MGKAFLIFFGDKSEEEIRKEIKRLDDKIVKAETDIAHDKAAKAELEEILAQRA
jgi:hypothetical protein